MDHWKHLAQGQEKHPELFANRVLPLSADLSPKLGSSHKIPESGIEAYIAQAPKMTCRAGGESGTGV